MTMNTTINETINATFAEFSALEFIVNVDKLDENGDRIKLDTGKYAKTPTTTTPSVDNYAHLPKASEMSPSMKAMIGCINAAYKACQRMMLATSSEQRTSNSVKLRQALTDYIGYTTLDETFVDCMMSTFSSRVKTAKTGEISAVVTSDKTFTKQMLKLTAFAVKSGAWISPIEVKNKKGETTIKNMSDEEFIAYISKLRGCSKEQIKIVA